MPRSRKIEHFQPLIAIIYDGKSGDQAVLLPLIRRLHRGIRTIEFADMDITDYNAQMLGAAAPRDREAALPCWGQSDGGPLANDWRRRFAAISEDARESSRQAESSHAGWSCASPVR